MVIYDRQKSHGTLDPTSSSALAAVSTSERNAEVRHLHCFAKTCSLANYDSSGTKGLNSLMGL
jgi:hypothetical protein